MDQELGSGITRDSLIFGMQMGQTKKEFFDICWGLNRKQVISAGNGDNTARFITDRDSLGQNTPDSKNMLFYGIFDQDDIMRGMDITYSYVSWAPWNRGHQSDSLLQALRHTYEAGYPGNAFIEIDLEKSETPALVKIDGNRQILMHTKGDRDVIVKIEDLQHKLDTKWNKK